MPRGYPDWGVDIFSYILTNMDILELITRSGGSGGLIRSGKALYSDTFDSDLIKWTVVTAGITSEASVIHNEPYSGLGSLRLFGGDAVADQAYIDKHFTFFALTKAGLEFVCKFNSADVFLQFFIYYHDGVDSDYRWLQIFNSPAVIKYIRVDGNHITLTLSPTPIIVSNDWTHIKLVADFTGDNETYLYINNVRYSLAGLSWWRGAPTNLTPYIAYRIAAVRNANVGDYCLIDSVVVTVDEP